MYLLFVLSSKCRKRYIFCKVLSFFDASANKFDMNPKQITLNGADTCDTGLIYSTECKIFSFDRMDNCLGPIPSNPDTQVSSLV